MMSSHKSHGANGSIHFADTALPKHDIIVAKATSVTADSSVHLTIFYIHCDDYSYFHMYRCEIDYVLRLLPDAKVAFFS
jgi:hypothetical protein